jgi:hypothetical protein
VSNKRRVKATMSASGRISVLLNLLGHHPPSEPPKEGWLRIAELGIAATDFHERSEA